MATTTTFRGFNLRMQWPKRMEVGWLIPALFCISKNADKPFMVEHSKAIHVECSSQE